MSDTPPQKNYLAEIALALSVVAFSGMGLFLIQWGQALAQVDSINENGSRALTQFKREQQQTNEVVKDKLHEIDKRTQRTEILLEGIADKLGVHHNGNNHNGGRLP